MDQVHSLISLQEFEIVKMCGHNKHLQMESNCPITLALAKYWSCLSPSVADHPLRPATDRRLGKPLPHQLASPSTILWTYLEDGMQMNQMILH